MQPGLVTVMIPSYNYARYLPQAVESAATQSNSDVVIVDNGSTDESPDVGRQLAESYDNVRFVAYPENEGIITSFNRCRDEVRGEYATLLCADDVLTPGSLERSRALMDEHPTVSLVYGPVEYFSTLDTVSAAEFDRDVRPSVVHAGADWIDRLCRTGANPIANPEALMRTSVLDGVGRYEPRTPYTSDLNLWLRMAAVCDVAYLPGPLQALFRRHDSNEGNAYPNASFAELSQRWMAFATFFEGVGDDPRRFAWETAARRRLAGTARYSASRAFVRRDDAEVESLLDLATEIDGAEPIRERIGWELRRFLGPSATRLFPPFAPRPIISRIERVIGDRRRARQGIA